MKNEFEGLIMATIMITMREKIKLICAIATVCMAEALLAEKVEVLVIPGDFATKTIDKTAKAYAKYFCEVADSLSLTTNMVQESSLPDNLRAAADAVVLGCNGKVKPATIEKLRTFVKDGGRLLGVHPLGIIRSADCGADRFGRSRGPLGEGRRRKASRTCRSDDARRGIHQLHVVSRRFA